MDGPYTIEHISQRTWKIVENDRFGQYPFLYVVMGEDKCIVIDTGCGSGNYEQFVTSRINTQRLPYLVVCTHVHFDHVGGNYYFCNGNCGLLGVAMGDNNTAFTQNYEINSLALAHSGAKVEKFEVTQWLKEGDFIYLNDNDKRKEMSLEVLHTPGHTPDSIAIFAHFENRLFVGDTIYPFTAIHLDSVGSNLGDYVKTLKKILAFCDKNKNTNPALTTETASATTTTTSTTPAPTTSAQPSPAAPTSKQTLSENQKGAINDFLNTLGLSRTGLSFNIEQLMEICDWQVDGAINFYLSSPSDVETMCPRVAEPAPPTSSAAAPAPAPPPTRSPGEIVLSCGHVEANLPLSSVQQMLDLLSFIVSGALPPAYSDGDYGEWSNEGLTVLINKKEVAKFSGGI